MTSISSCLSSLTVSLCSVGMSLGTRRILSFKFPFLTSFTMYGVLTILYIRKAVQHIQFMCEVQQNFISFIFIYRYYQRFPFTEVRMPSNPFQGIHLSIHFRQNAVVFSNLRHEESIQTEKIFSYLRLLQKIEQCWYRRRNYLKTKQITFSSDTRGWRG